MDTYATNVMGTVHLLEAVRSSTTVRAVIVITSDKCYDLADGVHPRGERDRLGGQDPYSSSKACAELVTAAYRAFYFSAPAAASIATARAGNVIGGGDWGADRLVPDLMRAWPDRRVALIRHPDTGSPWSKCRMSER